MTLIYLQTIFFVKYLFEVLPIIAPFTFGDDELNLDDSVSAVCSITKGDSPISIWWKFSGEGSEAMTYNLTTNDGIIITRTSRKVSTFAIEAVKSRHRGNYTCFASNKGGHAQYSAYLAINGLLERFYINYNQTFCNLFSKNNNLISVYDDINL